MKTINTKDLTPEAAVFLSKDELLWTYNGLDCCVTLEVKEALAPQLDNTTRATYEFEKSLQGPILEMDLRGVKVDLFERDRLVKELKREIDILQEHFNGLTKEGLGLEEPINWQSPDQLKHLFYYVLKIPPIKNKDHRPTVDRNALERLQDYYWAQPFAITLLALRDKGKRVSTLKTEIDRDARIRTSYNICGTETGRLSSSFNVFGTGSNLQNIADDVRKIFVADEGKKLAYIDLAQAESRVVGALLWNLFGDPSYLDACESGDLHTTISQMCWPNLEWTPLLEENKKIAEQKFYRTFSYRDMSKKLGHGSSYGGTPPTMAKQTKIPQKVVAQFQNSFFLAYPGFPRWHAWVEREIAETGSLTTLTGRRRRFFGRRNDPATLREAIAFVPQGTIGDLLNMGLLNLWRANICEILLQVHDAVVIQYPEHLEQIIVPQAIKLIQVPIELNNGRTLRIPSDAKVGWNWAKASASNPEGMKQFTEGENDTRQRQTALSLVG